MIEGPNGFDANKRPELPAEARAEAAERRVAQLEEEVATLKQHVATLTEKAETDALTGLLNRATFEKRMDGMIKSLSGERESDGAFGRVSLLFVDVDKFKSINDTHGHGAGDRVLQAIAGILKSKIRESDCAARWGGDEFAVGLLNAGDTAKEIADKIRTEVAVLELSEGPVTVSIGVGETTGRRSVLQLYARADEALYEVKEAGRNDSTVAGKLKN
jgi:diguanylate cyclase (GGDEF)-like protein